MTKLFFWVAFEMAIIENFTSNLGLNLSLAVYWGKFNQKAKLGEIIKRQFMAKFSQIYSKFA